MLELGCGISGLLGLVLFPKIGRFIATDQDYIRKILQKNLEENNVTTNAFKSHKQGHRPNSIKHIEFLPLDWELDSASSLTDIVGDDALDTFDAVLACDCVYNEALIYPFVQTCAELCRLRISDSQRPTLCLIAQQLRSPEVFEVWLRTFHRYFKIWRFPDELLTNDLRSNSGFVLYLGVPRSLYS